MKFSFDKSILLKELSIANEIVAARAPLSILSNILLIAKDNRLTIRATDLRIEFETSVPVEVEIEGTSTVFCDKFISIISSLPSGLIEVTKKDSTLIVQSYAKKSRFQLKTLGEEDFPAFTQNETQNFFSLPAKEFKHMIRQTLFSVSDDETRLFLNGVFMEKKEDALIVVATDGRRLAYYKKDFVRAIPDFPPCIIPTKILNILNKRLVDEGEIELAVEKKTIFFRFSNYFFASALIDGMFPDYERVIPRDQRFAFEVDKNDFIDAIRRVSLLIEQKSYRIFLNIASGTMTVLSQESEMGNAKEEIPCRYEGENILFALNYTYLLEPLKEIEQERVKIEFTDPLKAITLYPEPAESFFHIIMPMQTE